MSGSTAERIVHEARNLIMTRGYNGFSYADIAEAVGIRKASIHHHFPATDIPKQARALYVRNRMRVIPNVTYVPAPIRPAQSAPAAAGW